MRGLVWLGGGLLVLAWAGAGVAGITKGPYLQDVQSDRITVAAETDAGESCLVLWGDGLDHETVLVADGGQHVGVLSGLAPSSCVPYQLICGTSLAPESVLCTAPVGDAPIRFVVFGDTRSDHQAHADVIRAIAAESPAFVIHTGDLVSDGGDEGQWQTFFDIEGELMRSTPVYPVVGNHDKDDGRIDIYARLFVVPEGSGSDHYYRFSYGHAEFLILDNQVAGLGRPVDATVQGRWLAAELAAWRASPQRTHRFVVVHASMYSADDSRTGEEGLRAWRDEFLAAGVGGVFSGHDHHYARGAADNGLAFVVTGGGGAPLYGFREGFQTAGEPLEVSVWGWLPEPGPNPFTLFWTREVHHYVLVEIRGSRFEACAKEVLPGQVGPGVAFDCWSYTLAGTEPDPVPETSGCSCSPAGESASGLALLLGMGLLAFCLAGSLGSRQTRAGTHRQVRVSSARRPRLGSSARCR
jgi:hypothetical protein